MCFSDDVFFSFLQTLKQSKFSVAVDVSDKEATDDDESCDGGVNVSYKSKKSVLPEGPADQGATSILEIETETDRDAQAIFENSLKINKVHRFMFHSSIVHF